MSRRKGQRGSVCERNGQWRIRYYEDVRGQEKRVRRSLVVGPSVGPKKLTESQARRRGAQMIFDLGIDSEEHFLQATSQAQTFRQKAEWVEKNDPAFIEGEGRPGSINQMKSNLKVHILPQLGDLPLDAIDEQRVQEFIAHLKTKTFERRAKDGHLIKTYKLSRSTIRHIVKVVKRVVGKKTWISWTLKVGKPELPRQRYFTESQMQAIIDEANGQTWKLFFSTLRGTGIRVGECCGLDAGDIDFENNVVTIRRSYSESSNTMLPPKTAAGWREIDIDQGLSQELKQHLGDRTSGLVFRSKRGTPLRAGNVIKRVLNPILTKLGIPLGGKVNHAFRHGRVTVLRKRGIPEDLQKLWIGHTSTAMTDRYCHTDKELEYRRAYAARAGMSGVQ